MIKTAGKDRTAESSIVDLIADPGTDLRRAMIVSTPLSAILWIVLVALAWFTRPF